LGDTPPGEHDADAGEPDAVGIDGDIEIPDGDVIDGEDVVDGAGDTIPDDGGPDGEVPSVCDHAPSAFVLESPTHSATGVSVQPLLNWQDSTDLDSGDQVKYRVQVDDNDDFSSPVIDRADLTESQYQVSASEALNFDTLYFWKVIAYDRCPTEVPSAVFQFRTARMEVCNHSPTAFTLESPADNETGVSTTPTFNWSDSTDPDAGDTVTYRLIVSPSPDLSSPVLDKSGLTASEYTVLSTEALTQGVTYYWKVEAYDSCGNVTESGVRSFTTQPACTPRTIFDTNFVGGTPSNVVVRSGSIFLPEDPNGWTVKYEGDRDPTTVGWTVQAASGWTINEISGGTLHISTIGIDDSGRYERNSVPLDNSTGWVVETRMRAVVTEAGTDNPSGMVIGDNNRVLRPRFLTDRVNTQDYAGEYLLDGTVFHTYRMVGKGNNFYIYVNGALAIDGTGLMTISALANRIYFGDIGSTPDSETYWDYVYYYTGGDKLPHLTPGTYTSNVIDLGTSRNNIGSGATFGWTMSTPSGTSIIMRVRAGNTPDLSAVSWSAALATNPAVIPGSVTGRYFQWQAELSTTNLPETPVLEDVTLTYETCE
jgi:hypothetical protein